MKFHFVTVATKRNRHLERLEHSASLFDIPLTVLGLGDPYLGHGYKFSLIKQFVADLDDKDVVFFVDAYDVIFLADRKEIEAAFLNLNQPICFGAEFAFRVSMKNQFLTYLRYPKAETGYRFLNSGTYAAYVGPFKALLEAMQVPEDAPSDQVLYSRYFVNHPGVIFLDSQQHLFTCNGGRGALEDKDYTIEGSKLYAIKTKTYPKVLHIPGKLFIPLDQLTKQLGQLSFEGQYSDFDKTQYENAKKASAKPDFFKLDPYLYFMLEKLFIYGLVSVFLLFVLLFAIMN